MITNIYPNSFAGQFQNESDGFVIQGNFGTDAAKTINMFSGSAKKDNNLICAFDVSSWNGQVRYTYRDVTDTDALAEAVPVITATYEGCVYELAHPETEQPEE